MDKRFYNPGLAEVLRRSCALAPQPAEYHSTLTPMLFPPELTKAFDEERSADRQSKSLPRPVGSINQQVNNRDEMAGVAQTISQLSSRSISFKAPAGTGKSTILPWEVHQRSVDPVIVLTQTEVVAQGLVQDQLDRGNLAKYITPTSFSISRIAKEMGVVYTTVDGMIMRMFAAQKDLTDIDTPLVVFLDDSHLRSGSNEFFESMWVDYRSIKKLVNISTSLAAAPVPKSNGDEKSTAATVQPVVVSVPFKEEADVTLSDVMPDGTPAPWSVDGLKRKRTLMFVESDRIAEYMCNAYGNFVETFLLRRYHGWEYYKQVRAVLAEPSADGLLIIADSSQKTGMKMPLEQIIDFGNLRHTVAGSGLQPVDEYVKGTVSERAARVSKSAGLVDDLVVAFVPETPPANVDAELSSAERDKVAALCALFQYNVPTQYTPEFSGNNLLKAHIPSFLAGDLPWEVWNNIKYRGRVVEPESESLPPDIDTLIGWASQVRVAITPLELHSGQSYESSTGLATVRTEVANIIMDDYGDLYTWLREKIQSPGVRKFSDMSDAEAETVWLVWLTAWNWNVADLMALDRWRASHGRAVEDWRSRAECRTNVARLLSVARDIHDRWLLLESWYRQMFCVHPYQLVPVSANTPLVDERHAEMLRALGVGMVAPHIMGVPAAIADVRGSRRGGVVSGLIGDADDANRLRISNFVRRGRPLE